MTLIVRDENNETYAGTVDKRFTTTVMPELYSLDINESAQALKEIITTFKLKPFDNNHTEKIITLDSYGIYFIDLPNKTILTTDDYGDIKTVLFDEILTYLSPNVIHSNKTQFLTSLKTMLNLDYFLIGKDFKQIIIQCIDEFLDDPKKIKSANKFEKMIHNGNTFEFELDTEKLGWKITQADKVDLEFYLDLFLYFYHNNIYITIKEKEGIIEYLKENLEDLYEDDIMTEIDNIFIKVDSCIEKEHLENNIDFSHEENRHIKL